MVKVEMIAGFYGYRKKPGGTITPKRPGDPAFELPEDKAARLVAKGMARYVDTQPVISAKPMTEKSDKPVPKPDVLKVGKKPTVNDQPNSELAGKKAKELREIAKGYGLKFAFGVSNIEMIAAIEEAAAKAALTDIVGGANPDNDAEFDSDDSDGNEDDEDPDDDQDTDDGDDELDLDGAAPPTLTAEVPQ